MNNTHLFFSRFCHRSIPSFAAVMLVALAWSSLAFCGEIHDAARAGNVGKVSALLNDNPEDELSFSNVEEGRRSVRQ